ncbi:MAG: type II secretion system F family protein [Lachnospiraceae bacterium]
MKWSIKKSYWQQDIERKEYIAAIAKGSMIIVSISYLFYRSLYVNVILLPVLVMYLKIWNQQCIKKKQQIFQLQFKDSMQALSAALSVGYSVENAMKESLKDLQTLHGKETRIIKEFTYMVHQINMNITSEKVWEEFAKRVGQEDVRNFVTVFIVAKRAGGDSIAIIHRAVRIICEKIDVKREIETIMSAKKLEFQVMSFIPFGILGYMRLSFPEFMNILYGNILGIVIMTGSLIAYGGAYLLGRKIVEIEV